MPHAFQARVVFPVDSPPIDHGVVTIDGNRIVAVGTDNSTDSPLHDLGSVALLPGLINSHTHLEFSHLRRPLGEPGMRLVDWLRRILVERQARNQTPRDVILAGLRESAAGGVSTVGDIATADAEVYPCETPVELTLFAEVIGFSKARAASALAATEARLAAARSSLLTPRRSLGLSPHAPYTVSPELLSKLINLAIEHDLPVAMHLAESTDELELLAAGTGPLQRLLDERSMWDPLAIPRGSRPLDYLKALAHAARALVIHGNYLDAEEHAFLADRADRISLVYCPRTHEYFRHEPYPLSQLLAAGVRVALGTDSRASNPDLSVLGEMRHVARVHTSVAPGTILGLGTLAGAEALGRVETCGSITPGKLAHLVAALLSANDAPSSVWVAGQEL
jgi:cytosine/adenosine deaminase-related metal-dependent hydrolase